MSEALPTKTASSVEASRVTQQIQSRFNPIRGLEPSKLSIQLDNYHAGNIADAAKLWDAIERRDSQCQAVVPKRKRATALLDWEIQVADDSPEAQRQKEALEFCYNNVDTTEAMRKDRHGGFSMLVMQMMDAVGKGYAVHEIIWEPTRDTEGRDAYTACFVFVPLWFFENRTGTLRFLATDYAIDGDDLEPGGWMITTSDVPLMEATSVAFTFKNLSLKDWLIFSERFGFPFVHGKTSAKKDTAEWSAYAEAMRCINQDMSILTGEDGTLEFHDMGATGERPQQPLVEYMDKAITVLWRGGDLSTMSSDATGASQQEEERENIEAADALMISETLQHYVDKPLIAALFGSDAPILAWIQIQPKARVDTDRELKVWDFATSRGVPLAQSDLRGRFGLPSPKSKPDGSPDEPLLEKSVAVGMAGSGFGAANVQTALSQLDAAANEVAEAVAGGQPIPRGGARVARALELLMRTQVAAINLTKDKR